MKKIRVVVVDDSALVRNLMTAIIDREPDMEVVGTANDPYAARETIRGVDPDVVTLDVEMPRMDGLDFLEKLMRLRPTPVVMVSTLTERGAEVTLRALELGAIDYVAKPKLGVAHGLEESAREITEKIRVASRARVSRQVARPAAAAAPAVHGAPVAHSTHPAHAAHAAQPATGGSAAARPAPRAMRTGTEKLLAIGASTGGTEAIRAVLVQLPPDSPAIVITQHMPPGFTKSFAERLDGLCRIRVKEADHGERLLPGHAYIAPGGRHLRIERSGANYVTALDDSDPVNRHRPSVDVLFGSVAQHAGPNAIGVMLTGMGKDGALQMRTMHDAGAFTIAQDEASCVVYGMPREAVAAGAVDEVLPLDRIATRLVEKINAAGTVRHRI